MWLIFHHVIWEHQQIILQNLLEIYFTQFFHEKHFIYFILTVLNILCKENLMLCLFCGKPTLFTWQAPCEAMLMWLLPSEKKKTFANFFQFLRWKPSGIRLWDSNFGQKKIEAWCPSLQITGLCLSTTSELKAVFLGKLCSHWATWWASQRPRRCSETPTRRARRRQRPTRRPFTKTPRRAPLMWVASQSPGHIKRVVLYDLRQAFFRLSATSGRPYGVICVSSMSSCRPHPDVRHPTLTPPPQPCPPPTLTRHDLTMWWVLHCRVRWSSRPLPWLSVDVFAGCHNCTHCPFIGWVQMCQKSQKFQPPVPFSDSIPSLPIFRGL